MTGVQTCALPIFLLLIFRSLLLLVISPLQGCPSTMKGLTEFIFQKVQRSLFSDSIAEETMLPLSMATLRRYKLGHVPLLTQETQGKLYQSFSQSNCLKLVIKRKFKNNWGEQGKIHYTHTLTHTHTHTQIGRAHV